MDACFCCICFSFSVLSLEIGWEEHLQNDLFCFGWDVKPQLSQSIYTCTFYVKHESKKMTPEP